MTNQEILDSAPEGAEYIDGEGVYWRLYDKYTWAVENPMTGGFVRQMAAYPSNGSVRSLADIRRIVDDAGEIKSLENGLFKAQQRIKELEQDVSFYRCCALSGEIPDDNQKPSLRKKAEEL